MDESRAVVAGMGIDRLTLMAIVDAGGAVSAGRVIRGGADLVQVRAKGLTARDLITLVRGVIEETGSAVSKFHTGDRVLISCVTACGTCDACVEPDRHID